MVVTKLTRKTIKEPKNVVTELPVLPPPLVTSIYPPPPWLSFLLMALVSLCSLSIQPASHGTVRPFQIVRNLSHQKDILKETRICYW